MTMFLRPAAVSATFLIASFSPLQAQSLDCALVANALEPECYCTGDNALTNLSDPICVAADLGDAPITNFTPIVGPLLGAGVFAAVAGGTTSTTSTTGTVSP